jgi:Family of unknown function (DUF6152)
MRIWQRSLPVAAALALTPLGLSAHHGAGMFDGDTTVTVTGTVAEFQFVNPHVLIYLTVPGDAGDVRWGGELTSPNRLARMGGPVSWHKNILKPGDTITMAGHPARNGAPAMNITKIVTADGLVLIGQ